MYPKRRALLSLALAVPLLSLLGTRRSAAAVHRQQAYAFGTLIEAGVIAANADAAQKALAQLMWEFDRQTRDWHAWKEGVLTRLNKALAAGETVFPPAEIVSMLTEARHLARLSDGYFNPAIGKLIAHWGFHTDDPRSLSTVPDPREWALLSSDPPTMDHLSIQNGAVCSAHPLLQIDLGGYAKGVALDLALDRLAAEGFTDAIVNLGGNLAVSGRAGDRPWKIGIRDPFRPAEIMATLVIDQRYAVVTSGTYERNRAIDNKIYSHILNPKSGKPTEEIVSATVLHSNAARADAAATAIVAAGAARWLEIARSMGITEALVVEANGRVHITAPIADRLRFRSPPLALIRHPLPTML
ncbi:MAG: FAD:protein FMN transferase [Hydrogenophilus sp.]|nr:FAD:protein FMN transferase [Hydrogenophilus sp.]